MTDTGINKSTDKPISLMLMYVCMYEYKQTYCTISEMKCANNKKK